jgi:hypothetical protein
MGQQEPTLLELDGQLTGWVELGEEGEGLPRVRLTYVPSALWTQLVSRQEALISAVASMKEELSKTDEPDSLLNRIEDFSRRSHMISIELVGLSLRAVEGFDDLQIGPEGGVSVEQLEVIYGCGWFDSILGAVVRLHRVDYQTWRSLLCGRLGESVGSIPVQRVPAAG